MTVLDVSNWDRPTFDAECLAASGVTRLIIGCWEYDTTLGLLSEATEAGILVEDLYCFLYFGLGHEQREVMNALTIARARPGQIKRIWLDCEAHFTEWAGDLDTEAAGLDPGERIAAVKRAIAFIGAQDARFGWTTQIGIYTGRYYWRDKMGDTTEFSGLPLWHAAYGADSLPAEPITEVTYGGWTKPAAHQYTSRYLVCGRERDANYWFLEDTEMPDPRVDKLVTAWGGEAALDAWNARGNSLVIGYTDGQQKLGELTMKVYDLTKALADGGGDWPQLMSIAAGLRDLAEAIEGSPPK